MPQVKNLVTVMWHILYNLLSDLMLNNLLTQAAQIISVSYRRVNRKSNLFQYSVDKHCTMFRFTLGIFIASLCFSATR